MQGPNECVSVVKGGRSGQRAGRVSRVRRAERTQFSFNQPCLFLPSSDPTALGTCCRLILWKSTSQDERSAALLPTGGIPRSYRWVVSLTGHAMSARAPHFTRRVFCECFIRT